MELASENALEWYDEAAFSQVAVTTPGAGLAAFTVHVLAHAQEHAGRGGGGSGARADRLLRRNSLDSHHGLQIHSIQSSRTSLAPSPTPHSRAPLAASPGIKDSPAADLPVPPELRPYADDPSPALLLVHLPRKRNPGEHAHLIGPFPLRFQLRRHQTAAASPLRPVAPPRAGLAPPLRHATGRAGPYRARRPQAHLAAPQPGLVLAGTAALPRAGHGYGEAVGQAASPCSFSQKHERAEHQVAENRASIGQDHPCASHWEVP